MKNIFLCAMSLALLTSLSFAQRGRAIGGGVGGTRFPTAGAISPHAGVNPNSIGMPHGGVLPNATTGKTTSTVKPNATNNPKATTVKPNAETVEPDRVILPDSHTGPGPDR
jgi:hypothetical protein